MTTQTPQADSPFNLERIRELKALIEDDAKREPQYRRLNMLRWFWVKQALQSEQATKDLKDQTRQARTVLCGTTACLAGYAIILWGKPVDLSRLVNFDSVQASFNPPRVACQLLTNPEHPDVAKAMDYLTGLFIQIHMNHQQVIHCLDRILTDDWKVLTLVSEQP